MKYFNLVGFLFVALALSSCIHAYKNEVEILYKGKDGIWVDVFNVTQSWVSHEGQEYIKKRNHLYGEFGGKIKFCSNENFFCLRGGLSAVVPKKYVGQPSWAIDEIKCIVDQKLSNHEILTITCARNDNSIRFEYTQNRGIIRYWPSWEKGNMYELVDEKGLFANPEINSFSHEAVHKVD